MHQPASRECCYTSQDYDICIIYWPGIEMLIADALSHYAPLATSAISLDISVNHLHITPQKKIDFQDVVHSDPTLHALAEMILSGWPEDIQDVPMDLHPYHHARDVLTVKMASSYLVKLLSSPLQKGTRCYSLSMTATKEYPNANTMATNAFIGLASIKTSNMSLKHVLHASAITHRNLDSHSSQPQPLNSHGNTLEVTSCTLMAMSTSSSLTTTQRCPL